MLCTVSPYLLLFYNNQGDPDKRKFLRAAQREDGSEAHQPYCAKLEVPDPNHPSNRSAKAVWTFEYIERSTGGSVKWNSPVRIKHASSGKYLSVDTMSPFMGGSAGVSGVASGQVYACGLVRTANASAPAGSFGSAESLVFTIVPSDASTGSLPKGVTTLRIDHEVTHENGNKVHCYLHHSPLEKSSFPAVVSSDDDDDDEGGSKASKLTRKGERFLFTTVRYPQDVLRILPLDASQSKDVAYISSLVKPLKLYAYTMVNAIDNDSGDPAAETARFPKAASDLVDSVADVLLRVIQYNTEGSVEVILQRSTPEWQKLATFNLPAKFATFFTGDPHEIRQKISCDSKLIDAVFEVAIAAYNRFSKFGIQGKSPFAPRTAPKGMSEDEKDAFEEEDRMERTSPSFISKLAHVALQRLFKEIEPNEAYFSRRESLLRIKGSPIPEPQKWVRIISSQSEDPLGATVTLSRLLAANATIAKDIVTPPLLKGFLELIQRNGPQPRLIQLFSSVCICAGKAIPSNQEMVLRMLWLDASAKKAALINIQELGSDAAMTYGKVSGSASNIPKFNDGSAPADYLGKSEIEVNNGFLPTYVSWSGMKEWTAGNDELFYNWEGLGISGDVVKQVQKEHFIPIEWLCYVLEPERLTEPITKKKYVEYNEETATEEEQEEHERFKNHTQLADYFVAQLQLLTKMAKGRSYNVISWLTDDGKAEKPKGFSFTMLIGMASNPALPYSVRSESIYLLLALYVDRFPQLPRSGRPALPEKLWVAEDKPPPPGGRSPLRPLRKPTRPGGRDVASKERPSMATEDPNSGIPLIRKIKLEDPTALPAFSLPAGHVFSGDPDPVFGFPDDYKFYMLRRLTNDLVKDFGGRMILSNVAENTFACAALDASNMLLSFGFSATYKKLRDLLKPAATILDGRSDEETAGTYFTPAVHRWVDLGDAGYEASVRAKIAVVKLLSDVSDYRANYRLARILWDFKQLHDGASTTSGQLTAFYDDPECDEESPILQTMFDTFEELFNEPDDVSICNPPRQPCISSLAGI